MSNPIHLTGTLPDKYKWSKKAPAIKPKPRRYIADEVKREVANAYEVALEVDSSRGAQASTARSMSKKHGISFGSAKKIIQDHIKAKESKRGPQRTRNGKLSNMSFELAEKIRADYRSKQNEMSRCKFADSIKDEHGMSRQAILNILGNRTWKVQV